MCKKGGAFQWRSIGRAETSNVRKKGEAVQPSRIIYVEFDDSLYGVLASPGKGCKGAVSEIEEGIQMNM